MEPRSDKTPDERDQGGGVFSLTQGLHTTLQHFGRTYVIKRMVGAVWNYRRDFFHILFRKGVRSAFNFFYTKAFVPCGEGAGAAWYILIGGKLVRRFPWLAPFPTYIEFEHTTICDKKCIMCEHTYWKDQEERNLSFEEMKHIVDQFPTLRWAHITGEGSSFLNKNFLKTIRYIKDTRRSSVYLVDLFDGITEEQLVDLVDLGVEGVYVSIDAATKETYEKVRIGADFDRVVANVRRLVELKRIHKTPLPELSFRYIVLKPNLHEIPAFIDLVASFGTPAELGSAARVNFVGNLEYPEVQHLSVYELPKEIIAESLAKAKKYDLNVIFSHTEPATNPPIECCYAWLEPYIMMGGHVVPCCNCMMSNKRTWLREHAFGSVFQKSFREIWDSTRYKEFRRTVNRADRPVPLFCASCRSFDSRRRREKHGVAEEL